MEARGQVAQDGAAGVKGTTLLTLGQPCQGACPDPDGVGNQGGGF